MQANELMNYHLEKRQNTILTGFTTCYILETQFKNNIDQQITYESTKRELRHYFKDVIKWRQHEASDRESKERLQLSVKTYVLVKVDRGKMEIKIF